MFTNVAHRPPPHHFSYPQYSAQHSELDNPPLHQHPNDTSPFGRQDLVRIASFQQRLQRPEQSVHPVRLPSSLPTKAPNREFYEANPDSSEHMLRRKTPNGTLAAGYDGRPIEWTSRPHATKHYLIPTSNTLGETLYRSIPAGTLEEYSSARNDLSFSARAEEQRRQVRRDNIVRSQSAYENSNDVGEIMYSSHARKSDTLSATGLDSVLHQGSLSHQYNDFAGGPQVPTVLQPMWPPCLGLTSLNDSGPYGPYWPDGAFVPYRPAPLRDPRYQCPNQSSQTSDTNQLRPAYTDFQDWSRGGSNVDHMDVTEHSSDHYQSPPDHSVLGIDVSQGRGSFASSNPAYVFSPQHTNRFVYRAKPLPPRPRSVQTDNSLEPDRHPSISGPLLVQQAKYQDPNPRVTNAHFKEQVLVWAHRIYLSLLASVHHSRRAASQTHRNGERHAQPNIYPKAPRPFSLPLSAFQGRVALGLNTSPRLVARPYNNHDASRHRFTHIQHISDTSKTSPNDRTTAFEPISAHLHEYPSLGYLTPGCDDHNRPKSMMPPMTREYGSLPVTAAATAIEVLNRLCQESDWEWTDGLLLGGCLAYGLGDYQRALEWYSKVLHCDPK